MRATSNLALNASLPNVVDMSSGCKFNTRPPHQLHPTGRSDGHQPGACAFTLSASQRESRERTRRTTGAHSASGAGSGGYGQPAHPEARGQPSQLGATCAATQPSASKTAMPAASRVHAPPIHSDQQLYLTPCTSPPEPALSESMRSVNPVVRVRAARDVVVHARAVVVTGGARIARAITSAAPAR